VGGRRGPTLTAESELLGGKSVVPSHTRRRTTERTTHQGFHTRNFKATGRGSQENYVLARISSPASNSTRQATETCEVAWAREKKRGKSLKFNGVYVLKYDMGGGGLSSAGVGEEGSKS